MTGRGEWAYAASAGSTDGMRNLEKDRKSQAASLALVQKLDLEGELLAVDGVLRARPKGHGG
jgi:hypothetical protein